MNTYRVRYRVMNDREMLITGNNEKEARDHAELTMDPNNNYDWTAIISVEKVSEEEEI